MSDITVIASACPHCGVPYDPAARYEDGTAHVCADRDKWTQTERDEWRAIVKARHPWIQFQASTAVLQDRFGARNRADMEAKRANAR